MAKMGFAIRAVNFGAAHKKRVVGFLADRFFGHGGVKRRPSGAAFKLGGGVKQVGPTAGAGKHAVGFGEIVVAVRPFSGAFAADFIGKVRQLRTPFLICFCDFRRHFHPFLFC